MKLNGKVVDLPQLLAELNAAGIPASGLIQNQDDLLTNDVGGQQIDLPAAAAPVIAAHVPTPPLVIDYGTDAPADYAATQLQIAVTNLRQYLQAASPTQAATVAALKLTIRVVLFLARRQF
jgi:hypothetical protein